MSNDPKSTPKSGGVICGHCGAVERDGVIPHKDECPDREIDRGRGRDDEPTKKTGRVQLLERDRVRLHAIRDIATAGKSVIGAVLDAQFQVKRAAEDAAPADKIDAVIDAGTNAVQKIAGALGGVQTAVRKYPGKDPAAHSTARFVVRRRVTHAGEEDRLAVVGEGETEDAGSNAYDDAIIEESQRLAPSPLGGATAIPYRVGDVIVIELLERKPGGLIRRRSKRFEVAR